jgi:NAD(P)-dependent dehydrogenase (short-subunit alcohol dehydrogenase family)
MPATTLEAMTETTIALVTGANKGIGYAIADQLATGHAVTVLLGARDPGKGHQTAAALRERGGDVRAITLDVTSPATITDAAALIGREYGRLDILVNNAGISPGRDAQRPGTVDLDIIRAVFETNVFGVIAVTEAMLPLLRESASARVVNVSSGTGSLTWMTDPDHYFASLPGSAGYPVSKTALNMLTVQYAKALAADGIAVNAIAPGACATDFLSGLSGRVITRTAADGARIAVRLAAGPGGAAGGFFDDDGRVPW